MSSENGRVDCVTPLLQSEIVYSATGGPAACTSDVYPPGLSKNESTYREINEGLDFGQSTNTSVLIDISINQFFSASGFGTNQTNFRRRIVLIDAPTSNNQMKTGMFSVSECPGDFTSNARCRRTINRSDTLRFSTYQDDDPGFYCILEPGETYYINFVLSQDPYNVPPECLDPSDTVCAVFYSETGLTFIEKLIKLLLKMSEKYLLINQG